MNRSADPKLTLLVSGGRGAIRSAEGYELRGKGGVMEGKSTTEMPEAFALTSSPGRCDGPGGGSGEASRGSSGEACFIWRTLVWFLAGLCKVLAVEARPPAGLAL